MSPRATRGYWKLGAIGCRGASRSEQLDDKELRGALGSAIGAKSFPFSGHHHRLLMPLHLLQYGMLISKDCVSFCCTAVMQKSSTLYSSVFLSCSMRSCIEISARSLLSKRIFVCSVRAAFENSYNCSSCLFWERLRSSLTWTVVPLFTCDCFYLVSSTK